MWKLKADAVNANFGAYVWRIMYENYFGHMLGAAPAMPGANIRQVGLWMDPNNPEKDKADGTHAILCYPIPNGMRADKPAEQKKLVGGWVEFAFGEAWIKIKKDTPLN